MDWTIFWVGWIGWAFEKPNGPHLYPPLPFIPKKCMESYLRVQVFVRKPHKRAKWRPLLLCTCPLRPRCVAWPPGFHERTKSQVIHWLPACWPSRVRRCLSATPSAQINAQHRFALLIDCWDKQWSNSGLNAVITSNFRKFYSRNYKRSALSLLSRARNYLR